MDTLTKQRVNRISGAVSVVLSVIALLAVFSGYLQPPPTDEGAAAHIFQLAILGAVAAILSFLATVDWKQPLRNARLAAFPAAALVLAFVALYYLEHYR